MKLYEIMYIRLPNLQGILAKDTFRKRNLNLIFAEQLRFNDGYCFSLPFPLNKSFVVPVTDLCSSHPCQNGADCQMDNDEYYCHCLYGFEGRHCETTSRVEGT